MPRGGPRVRKPWEKLTVSVTNQVQILPQNDSVISAKDYLRLCLMLT